MQDVPIPRGIHDLGKDMRVHVPQVIADQMPHLQPAPGALDRIQLGGCAVSADGSRVNWEFHIPAQQMSICG